MLRYANGARGALWASQVAPGNENGLRIRIYGTKGGLHWVQADPNHMLWSPFGQSTRIVTRGGPDSGVAAGRVTRIPPGHPEGYLEGFANIYSEIAEAIKAARSRQETAQRRPFPDHRRRRQRPRLHRSRGEIVEGQRQVDEAVDGEHDISLPSSEQTVIKRKRKDMSHQDHPRFFDPHQRETVAAAMARIIPTDDVPGASEAGCVDFIDLYLSGIDHIYAKPDGSGFETLSGVTAESWTRRIGILRQKYIEGIGVLDAEARTRFDAAFFQLDAEQQDEILTALEHSGSQPASAGGPPGEGPALQQTLDRNRSRISAAAGHAHAARLLLRPDLRRQQGPRRLGRHRLSRTRPR